MPKYVSPELRHRLRDPGEIEEIRARAKELAARRGLTWNNLNEDIKGAYLERARTQLDKE